MLESAQLCKKDNNEMKNEGKKEEVDGVAPQRHS
jgi:hypothetical protein